MNEKKKILFVDDEPVNLFIFKVSFRDLYEVLTAESGREALELLANTESINMVFSDLRMPIMDGIEFISKAKAINNEIKYNLISGYQLNEEIKNAIEAGIVNKYFSKPFDKQELVEEIEKN